MKIKYIARCGVLTAVALTIFVVENMLPPLVAIPGIKLGLANIITLLSLIILSPKEGFLILCGRILLGAFFIGAPSTLLYSLAGGIGCFLAELLLIRIFGKNLISGISAIGGMVHNILQLLVAFLITKTPEIFYYLPFLLISGILTGLFNGLCVWFIINRKK